MSGMMNQQVEVKFSEVTEPTGLHITLFDFHFIIVSQIGARDQAVGEGLCR